MSKTCPQFAQGYKSHWSKEIFCMGAMQDTSPVTYVVADATSEPIKGTFYGPELQKVTPPGNDDTIMNACNDSTEGDTPEEGEDEAPADQHPCQGTTFIRGHHHTDSLCPVW